MESTSTGRKPPFYCLRGVMDSFRSATCRRAGSKAPRASWRGGRPDHVTEHRRRLIAMVSTTGKTPGDVARELFLRFRAGSPDEAPGEDVARPGGPRTGAL